MSYRCQLCRAPVPTGTPRINHVIKRVDGSISRELSVCQCCHDALASGKTAKSMLPQRVKLEPPEEAVPVTKSPIYQQPLRS